MRKAPTKKISGMSWLAAACLALALAALGCSSNQYAGNGQPTPATPTINTVNHSGTYGSSSGTAGVRPMSSSYVYPSSRGVNVDAMAILAAEQGFRGRILGPVNPPNTVQGSMTLASGQDQVYSQQTVNSSINSQPTSVITSGVGNGITFSNGTTAGATTRTTAAMRMSAAAATPATAATGALRASSGAGSVAGSATFSPVMMNSTPAPQATGTTNHTLSTIAATGRGSTAKFTSKTTTGTTNVNVVSGIQIQQNANGGIMMTNVPMTASTVKGK